MTLSDGTEAINGISNEASKESKDSKKRESCGIETFKEYLVTLLPSNPSRLKKGSSTVQNGACHEFSACESTNSEHIVAVSNDVRPDEIKTVRNGTNAVAKDNAEAVKNGTDGVTQTNTNDLRQPSSKACQDNTSENHQNGFNRKDPPQEQRVNDSDQTACPVEIMMSDTAGRYLTAKRNVSAGEVLFMEPPVVLAPRPKSPPNCLNCFSLTDSYKCPECGFFFCGPQCLSVEDHKSECSLLKRLGLAEDREYDRANEEKLLEERLQHIPPERREEARKMLAAAKASSRDQSQSAITQQYVILATLRTILALQKNDFHRRVILSMQCNYELGGDRYEMNQRLIVDVIVNRLGVSVDPELVHKICSIWDTSAFQVVLPQNNRIQGIYPFAGLINHDCRPNAQQWFTKSGEIVIRATNNIQRGDAVTISYTDPQWSTIVRQNNLQKSKQFTCTCERCLDPSELGTFLGSLLCPSCGSSPLVSSSPLDASAQWVCTTPGCSRVFPVKQVLSIGTGLGTLAQKVKPGDVKAVMSLANLLKKKVHANHYSLMQLYMSVVNTLAEKDLTELSDDELSHLCDITAHVMTVLRKLQAPLSRTLATTSREDLRLRIEALKRTKKISGEDVEQRLMDMSSQMNECLQVLEWDPSMPSSKPLLKEYQSIRNSS